MGLFTVREPRRFEHKYIYYDERKEKLDKIEENAKRDLGILPADDEGFNPENIRGKFLDATKHLKRRKQNGGPRMPLRVSLVLLAVLIFLAHWIVTGEFF